MRLVAIALVAASTLLAGCNGILGVQDLTYSPEDGGIDASPVTRTAEGGLPGAPDAGEDSTIPDGSPPGEDAPVSSDDAGDSGGNASDASDAAGDPCATANGGCAANATCTSTGPGARSCSCDPGYSGDGFTCTPIGACATNNGGCSVDATCTEVDGGSATCTCKSGYTGNGTTCTAVDSCATSNGGCSANATCTSTGPGTNTCACNTGYSGSGTVCTAINSCSTNDGGCSANATCTSTGPGTNTCACNTGYSGSGTVCSATNSCATSNGGCSANATCTSTGPGTNTCACNSGYTGNGVTCTGTNGCATNNGGCAATAKCTSTGPGTVTCACNTGYTGNGTTCTAVNACLTSNGGCSADATCTDTGPGTVTCACKTGYSGNGTTCTAIDNCSTNNGGCATNATCTDTGPGTSSCTCKAGYSGNGTTCTAINDCTTNNGGCSADATCTDTGPGTNTCTCNTGYSGSGTTCTAINNCTTNNGGCSADATCTDTGPGTNSCACKTGYSGNGTTCTAIDNCLTNNGGCSPDATCTDTGPGTNTCACKAGYTGNGTTCAALETLTFSMSLTGGAVGSVSSTPAGVSCSGTCNAFPQFASPTSVTLKATVTTGNFHWTGACSGSSTTCTVVMNTNVTVGLVVTNNNYMFISSTLVTGNLGGLTGGDAICQTAANNAGLPGTYQALLATGGTNLTSRLSATGARGWIRVDGEPFADQVSDLTSGAVLTPPMVMETGAVVASPTIAWTGAYDDGTPSGTDCTGFTSSTSSVLGSAGSDNGAQYQWYYAGQFNCNDALPVLCFGTSLSNPLQYAHVSGRIAFLSEANFDTSMGLSGGATGITTGSADVLCQTEASAAGISGTFLALLPTTTASAASRFNTTEVTWVSPNGVPIAATAASFMQGTMLTGLTQHADQTYANGLTDNAPNSGFTRTGAFTGPDTGAPADPLTSAASAADTCSNWSTGASTSTGSIGWQQYATSAFFAWQGGSVGTASGWPVACGATLPIYCLQE